MNQASRGELSTTALSLFSNLLNVFTKSEEAMRLIRKAAEMSSQRKREEMSGLAARERSATAVTKAGKLSGLPLLYSALFSGVDTSSSGESLEELLLSLFHIVYVESVLEIKVSAALLTHLKLRITRHVIIILRSIMGCCCSSVLRALGQ